MGSLTPTLGLGMSGMGMMSQGKMASTAAYGFSTPQSMMQPQTPVSFIKLTPLR